MSQKLFEFAVIYTPALTKEQREAGEKAKSKLVVDVTRVLANDEAEVNMLAARAIPVDYADKLQQVEIAVRPF
jgi:hypothetical protein